MQGAVDVLATREYDLEYLLKNPNTPLTVDQWNNFDDYYMRMINDDKPANEVDIGPGVARRIKEIREKGTYWR